MFSIAFYFSHTHTHTHLRTGLEQDEPRPVGARPLWEYHDLEQMNTHINTHINYTHTLSPVVTPVASGT